MSDSSIGVSTRARFRPSEPGHGPLEGAAVTVRQALQLDSVLVGAPEVLVGQDSLDRPIRWVHSGEMTTVADSLVGGELLLTTGLAIPSDDDGRRRFVRELAGRSVAALCIELGGPFAEAPEALVDEARRFSVPIVVFRQPVLFVLITEQIHTMLIDHRYALLRDVQAGSDELMAVVLAKGGAPDLLDVLARLLNNPVGVVGPAGIPIVCSNPPRLGRDAAESWPDLAAVTAPVWASAAMPASRSIDQGSFVVAYGNGALLPEHTQGLLDRAAQLVALTTPVRSSTRDRRAHERADVLQDLLDGRTSVARLSTRLQRLDFAVGSPFFVPFVVRPGLRSYRALDVWAERGVLVQEGWPRRRGSLLVAHSDLGGLRGVFTVASATERAEAADALVEVVRNAFGQDVDETTRLIVGQSVPIEELGSELLVTEQSATSLQDGAPSEGWIDSHVLELSRFAWAIRDRPEARQFVGRVLAAFSSDGVVVNAHLLETLRVYCDTLGHKAETARLLHLNRQSLYARLARIEELTGIAMDTTEAITTFRLALLIADSAGLKPRS
jgi:purine catabolism regulator